jgi:hypothetical protein
MTCPGLDPGVESGLPAALALGIAGRAKNAMNAMREHSQFH